MAEKTQLIAPLDKLPLCAEESLMFTRSLTYQFGVFFQDLPEIPKVFLSAVASHFGADANPKYLLRGLKDPIVENGLISIGGSALMPMQTWTWTTNTGAWRINLARSRLDVFFDAQAYFEAKDNHIGVVAISTFVCPKITSFFKATNLSASRLALIVTGQTGPDDNKNASSIRLAEKFLQPSLIELSRSHKLIDGTVRLNSEGNWDIGSATGSVIVNKIETVTANWVLRDGAIETSTSWQADANTTPVTDLKIPPGDQALAKFFAEAANWTAERQAAMEEQK